MLKKKLSDAIKGRMNRYKRESEGYKAAAAAPTGPRVTILYGSETGNSEALSRELGADFERRDYAVSVQSLDDIDPSELPTMGFVVIALATCGQGVFPKNSQAFWAELQKPKEAGFLKDLKYCVFGLGDSSYYFFNYTAKLVDARMAELGASRIVPTMYGDDGDEDKFETKFNEWIPTVWKALGTKTPENKLFEPTITVNYTPDAKPSEFQFGHSSPVQSKTGAVRITPKDYSRSFVTIEWKTDLPYRIGDSLGVFPENNQQAVDQFLGFYGLDGKAVVTIDNRGTRELPEVITVSDLFSKVLDLLGKPNRRFYQNLAHFATDASEKERLTKMGAGEGEYSATLAETYHYADMLKTFKSAKPPLQYLIEMIGNIKPRYYSISSSPKHTPGEVHSLVLIDTWTTPAGRFRTGLTCSMLEKLQAGQVVSGCIHPTAMEFPDSDERPKVMAGIGSGLAPFVAFLRERSWKRKQGIKVGQMVLYFGNQYEKKEFLMEEELKGYVKEGLLHLRTAFSRDDPKKKVYVQDLVKQDPELLYDLLVKQKGSVYVCGNRNMPKPVQNSIQYCFTKGGNMTDKQAEDYVVEMYTTGRFNIESW
jgi:sulfite reductase alpha subunit-like flavoprotein